MAGARRRFTARNIIVALLGIYLFGIIASYGWNFISATFIEVSRLKKGVLEETLTLEGTLVRDEKMLTAPGTGKIHWLIEEGQRVRLQARLAEVKVASVDSPRSVQALALRAPITGLIYYQADGLESIYTPEFIKQLDRRKITSVSPLKIFSPEGEAVEKGHPVAKIVNNHVPAYIWGRIKTTPQVAKALTEGKKYTSHSQSSIVEVTVYKVWPRDKETEFLLQTRYLPAALNSAREVSLALITCSFNGYIIPKGALVFKNGKPGVYTSYKEKVYWKKIKVLGELAGKVAIKDDAFPEGTRYISNPGWTEEGRYVGY